MRMLRRHVGTPADAEDAAQEVFARLVAAGTAVPLAQAQPYLRRAARHVAIDGWRKSAGREHLQQMPLDEDRDAATPGLPEGADSTAARAEQRQLIARLDQALEELPPRQREAFVLHRIEGHTLEETAERMGISARMVVKHLGRGLAYCQARIMYASMAQMRHSLDLPPDDTDAPT